MAPPTIVELHQFLRRHNALIVHFSGIPKGVGPGTASYPDDLRAAIASKGAFELSCSAVKPGDKFDPDPGVLSAATGSVGIIVDPRGPSSIKFADADDHGSMYDPRTNKRIGLPGMTVSAQSFEDSFAHRTRYNEWVVGDYDVRGIFIFRPIWLNPTTQMPLQRVAADFPGMPIFTFSFDEIFQVIPTDHKQIYA